MIDTSNLAPGHQQVLKRLKDDFKFYARNCLKISTKDGSLIPLVFNSAQEYLHQRIEEQKAKTGMVRTIIVKGRQQGCSTYVEARYFHQAQMTPGLKAFILTHHSKSTEQLFGMVKQYAAGFPKELTDFAASDTQNRNQFVFSASKSSYAVGTAGSDAVGRGFTLQLFHGSEVAFWENTSEIAMGALKAVNPVPGTEIILESTANGVGNFFHNMALAGLDPDSTYQTVFIPWFWQAEYRRAVPANFSPTDEEKTLKSLYSLTDEQIFWRRRTIIDEFEGEAWRFQQEYPNTLAEAFVSATETFFNPNILAQARKAKIELIESAPRVMGVDLAGMGADRSVILIRQGRHIIHKAVYRDHNTSAMAALVAQQAREFDVDRIFVDIGNAGPGVYDRLVEDYGLADVARAVNFGSGATRQDLYQNKRAEMIFEAKKWTESEGGVVIPDEDGIVTELLAHPRPKPSTVRGTWLFKAKDEIKAELKRSPDEADALFLTFAEPVQSRALSKLANEQFGMAGISDHKSQIGGSKTMAHFRARQRGRR